MLVELIIYTYEAVKYIYLVPVGQAASWTSWIEGPSAAALSSHILTCASRITAPDAFLKSKSLYIT